MTAYLTQLEKSLSDMTGLKDNWDGRRSSAPSQQAMQTASAVWACPLGSGGIQLEIHAGGTDIEIEIDLTGKINAVSWSRSPR